ncbi:MAG: hypothetical protein JSS87_15200 [Acidobacteria bacterium]|nr:hypothetical protein [Acidobacteriota bacterium]
MQVTTIIMGVGATVGKIILTQLQVLIFERPQTETSRMWIQKFDDQDKLATVLEDAGLISPAAADQIRAHSFDADFTAAMADVDEDDLRSFGFEQHAKPLIQ